MQVTVLMSSGDQDEWTDVQAEVAADGTLILTDEDSKTPYQRCAIYAPGMWMKAEFRES